VSQMALVRGWISVYSAKFGAGDRMDFSLDCQNRRRRQDGFQSRLPKSAQAAGWISV